MDIMKSYKDLCRQIEIWKTRVEAYKAEIKALNKLAKIYGPSEVKGIDYTKPYIQETGQLAFEDYLNRLKQLDHHIYLHEEAIKRMTDAKNKIKEKIEELQGLDKKVVYMRDIQGMTLTEIAEELGYSYQYIKEVSARNKTAY